MGKERKESRSASFSLLPQLGSGDWLAGVLMSAGHDGNCLLSLAELFFCRYMYILPKPGGLIPDHELASFIPDFVS